MKLPSNNRILQIGTLNFFPLFGSSSSGSNWEDENLKHDLEKPVFPRPAKAANDVAAMPLTSLTTRDNSDVTCNQRTSFA
jgi:hypothetical protein